MPYWPAISRPIPSSLTEVSYVTWRGVPLEMTGRTKGGALRARTLKAYVRRGSSPITATPIYHLSILIGMQTLFYVTSHVLPIVILSQLKHCWLIVKSIWCLSTGAIFSGVQYCLGYCEGEMACVLMISIELQRPLWYKFSVFAGTSKDWKQQIFLLVLLQVRATHFGNRSACDWLRAWTEHSHDNWSR
jgi:hypothetical protein